MSGNTQLAEKLYDDRDKTGDVTFLVQSQSIRAHRCVLAAFSPKYKAQLYDTELDKDNIQVNGVTAAAFNEFLCLFYFDKPDLTLENIGAVLDMAKQSLVDDFVNKCVDFMKRILSLNNMCSVYRLATLYEIEDLMKFCERKIGQDAKQVFGTDDFLQCEHETILRILNFESLNCKETDVFDACIEWARAACVQKGIDVTKPENLRDELGDALYQVRFILFTLEEFATRHKSMEGFFTFKEWNEIMYIIAKLKDFKSNKFNQTSREFSLSLVDCDFVCNRILPVENQHEPLPILHSNNLIPIEIICNMHVEMVGFAINNLVPIKDLDEFVIFYKKGRSIVPSYSIKQTQDETIVVFEKTITISEDALYIANSSICSTGVQINRLAAEVKIDDFRFNFSGNSLPISRLFCSALKIGCSTYMSAN